MNTNKIKRKTNKPITNSATDSHPKKLTMKLRSMLMVALSVSALALVGCGGSSDSSSKDNAGSNGNTDTGGNNNGNGDSSNEQVLSDGNVFVASSLASGFGTGDDTIFSFSDSGQVFNVGSVICKDGFESKGFEAKKGTALYSLYDIAPIVKSQLPCFSVSKDGQSVGVIFSTEQSKPSYLDELSTATIAHMLSEDPRVIVKNKTKALAALSKLADERESSYLSFQNLVAESFMLRGFQEFNEYKEFSFDQQMVARAIGEAGWFAFGPVRDRAIMQYLIGRNASNGEAFSSVEYKEALSLPVRRNFADWFLAYYQNGMPLPPQEH